MTNDEYIAESLRTLANGFHNKVVGCDETILAMQSVAGKCQHLDVVKKALFYGKPVPAYFYFPNPETSQRKYADAIPALQPDRGDVILHGAIGIATEAGELLEAVIECMVEGKSKPLDRVNVKEELGDLFWYIAVICDAMGLGFEEIMAANIAKLKLRFPDNFSEEKAIDRDITEERKLLEAGEQQ